MRKALRDPERSREAGARRCRWLLLLLLLRSSHSSAAHRTVRVVAAALGIAFALIDDAVAERDAIQLARRLQRADEDHDLGGRLSAFEDLITKLGAQLMEARGRAKRAPPTAVQSASPAPARRRRCFLSRPLHECRGGDGRESAGEQKERGDFAHERGAVRA